MGLLGGFFNVVGGMALDIVKDGTGVDIAKGINTVKGGGTLDDVLYDMKGDVEGAAYSKFRAYLRRLSNEEFRQIRTDDFIDVQMRAYEDERRRRRL